MFPFMALADTRLIVTDQDPQKRAPDSPDTYSRAARLGREPDCPMPSWSESEGAKPEEKPHTAPPPAKPPLHSELGPNDLRLEVTATLCTREANLVESVRTVDTHNWRSEHGRIMVLTGLQRLLDETRSEVGYEINHRITLALEQATDGQEEMPKGRQDPPALATCPPPPNPGLEIHRWKEPDCGPEKPGDPPRSATQ